jgi:CheY-specific phosphatase CheX
MNVQDLIVNSIRHSVVEIFSTMLASEINPGEVVVEPAAPEANDGVVSFIGIAGTWTGTGSITCSPPWPAASAPRCFCQKPRR